MEIKSFNVNVIITLFIAVSVFIDLQQSLAAPYEGGALSHRPDFVGVVESIYGDNFDKLMKSISQTIDNELPQRITKQFGVLPGYNHRIFGHWGFEGKIPFDIEPYKTHLGQYPRDQIIKIWHETVNELAKQAEALTGLPPKQAKALVGLLYNTHLLGDLKPISGTNRIIEPLTHLIPNRMRKDISTDLNRLFGNNSHFVKEIEKKLALIKTKDPKLWSDQVLHVLKKHKIGDKLYSGYGNSLEKHQIYNSRKQARLILNKSSSSQKLISSKTKTVNTALKGASVVALFSGLSHGWQLVNGEEESIDALAAIVKDAGLAGSSIYVSEAIIQNIGNGKYMITAISNPASSIGTQALGAGLNFGIATFIFDQTMNVYDLYSGKMDTSEFVDATRESVMKAGVTGGAVYCAVILGATPGGFIVIGVSVGTYMAVNYAINVFKKFESSFYLTANDLLLLVPESILRKKAVLDILLGTGSEYLLFTGDRIFGNSVFDEIYGNRKQSMFDEIEGSKRKGEKHVLDIF